MLQRASFPPNTSGVRDRQKYKCVQVFIFRIVADLCDYFHLNERRSVFIWGWL